jgi:hypothetical protein
MIFLQSFDEGDWRGLLRFNTIPAIMSILLTLFFLRESPRLLLAKGDFVEAFREIDLMGRVNRKTYPGITEEEVMFKCVRG